MTDQWGRVQPGYPKRALFQVLPKLASRVPLAPLGQFPTPVVELPRAVGRGPCFVKRDDLSSPVYGGNKVRTLEILFGRALEQGVRSIYATGAYGSNHAVATALHAPRVGLSAGALLFPQPASWAALENLRVVLSTASRVVALPHWAVLPLSMWSTARRRFESPSVMAPGGATPWGALGYVSAALELAEQVEAGVMPAPRRVVVGVGSTCTSAGLLVGFQVAFRRGLGFRRALPELIAVRVTPWPITSKYRIGALAERTSRLLVRLAGEPGLLFGRAELAGQLQVDAAYLGGGYGLVTEAGELASRRFVDLGLPGLDTTYSAKAAAGFFSHAEREPGPTLFWSTKSSVPLPEVNLVELQRAPPRMRRWMARAEQDLASALPAGYRRLPGPRARA